MPPWTTGTVDIVSASLPGKKSHHLAPLMPRALVKAVLKGMAIGVVERAQIRLEDRMRVLAVA